MVGVKLNQKKTFLHSIWKLRSRYMACTLSWLIIYFVEKFGTESTSEQVQCCIFMHYCPWNLKMSILYIFHIWLRILRSHLWSYYNMVVKHTQKFSVGASYWPWKKRQALNKVYTNKVRHQTFHCSYAKTNDSELFLEVTSSGWQWVWWMCKFCELNASNRNLGRFILVLRL